MSNPSEKFEMFMVVELFGHQKISGKVSEQTIGGNGFIRVDVPQTTRRDGFTKFYGGGAIYAMTPVSEQVAKLMAERLQSEPVSEYTLSQELQKMLSDPAEVPPIDEAMEGLAELVGDDYDYSVHEDDLDVPFEGDMPDPPEPVIEPEPEIDQHEQAKRAAAQWARDLLAGEFIVLDTETTGLNKNRADQPVQIAVVTNEGEVLLDTLVKPTITIEPGAARVHKLDEEALKDAPTFGDVREKLAAAIEGKKLVIYNSEYDLAILNNASKVDDPEAVLPSLLPASYGCAMTQYAAFNGEWSDWHSSYTFKKLTDAARNFGIKVVDAHSALGDCLMTLEVIKHMAGYNTATNEA